MPDSFSEHMNNQLRALTGTTVNLEEAGDEIGAALRGQPSPSQVKQGKVKLDPEPPPTAGIREWQRWAEDASPLMDDQGRVPGERGYTRPAADSFSAMGKRNGRWSRAHKEARQDANQSAR
jgi:hypothetical protein